jgi:hypothetical protein
MPDNKFLLIEATCCDCSRGGVAPSSPWTLVRHSFFTVSSLASVPTHFGHVPVQLLYINLILVGLGMLTILVAVYFVIGLDIQLPRAIHSAVFAAFDLYESQASPSIRISNPPTVLT